MPVLSFGVIDAPYTQDESPANNARQARNKRRNEARAAFGGQEYHGTTGDVAEILEAKYHVMEIFAELHEADIKTALEESIGDSLADLLSSNRQLVPTFQVGSNSMAAAEKDIEHLFVKFIDSREMDGIQPGVPTAAAKAGVNHRLKRPYAKGNPERPSFKDTGLYLQSMKVEFLS